MLYGMIAATGKDNAKHLKSMALGQETFIDVLKESKAAEKKQKKEKERARKEEAKEQLLKASTGIPHDDKPVMKSRKAKKDKKSEEEIQEVDVVPLQASVSGDMKSKPKKGKNREEQIRLDELAKEDMTQEEPKQGEEWESVPLSPLAMSQGEKAEETRVAKSPKKGNKKSKQ